MDRGKDGRLKGDGHQRTRSSEREVAEDVVARVWNQADVQTRRLSVILERQDFGAQLLFGNQNCEINRRGRVERKDTRESVGRDVVRTLDV